MNINAVVMKALKGAVSVPVFHLDGVHEGVYIVFYTDFDSSQSIGCGKRFRVDVKIQIFSSLTDYNEDVLSQETACAIDGICLNNTCGIASLCGTGFWEEDFIEVCNTKIKVREQDFVATYYS